MPHHAHHRLALTILLAALTLSGSLLAPPRARAAEACFAETGFCVRGRFLDYWQANGGLARNGFPLTDERQELLEDGNAYTVQYFERVRLELHPENPAPYDVLLGQFGRRYLSQRIIEGRTGPQFPFPKNLPPEATRPAAARPGQVYFPQTGHNLGGRFLTYWQANGDLAQFGYPLTEEAEETLEDGQTYTVQYFERARFELHPENADPQYQVLLGQFGRRIALQVEQLADNAAFFALYTVNPAVREGLGVPSSPAVRQTVSVQEFERGRLIGIRTPYERHLFALCGDQQAGRVLGTWPTYYVVDRWTPDQPVGGGPGPRLGRYEPREGFGLLWRENAAVRDCLGYAIAPHETASTVAVKYFYAGALLADPAADGFYALFSGTYANGDFALDAGHYQRFPAPAR